MQVTPCMHLQDEASSPNVPPLIKNGLLKELARFRKFSSAVNMIPLGCKNTAVKHVLSFQRQVFMYLNSLDETSNVLFKCNHGRSSYRLFTSTESVQCFECGDIHTESLAAGTNDSQSRDASEPEVEKVQCPTPGKTGQNPFSQMLHRFVTCMGVLTTKKHRV